MGFEASLFLSQPVDENLTCSLCWGVYAKPSAACSNGHVYCLGCLSKAKERSHACPDCRQDMLEPAPPIRPLENLIGKLQLCCENSVPKKTKQDDRHRQEPPATRRRTTESGEAVEGDKERKAEEKEEVCEWQGLVSEYRRHIESCPFRIVQCPLECKAEMEYRLLDHHKENECPHRNLPAPPPSYPRSYRKPITEGKHAGMICCTLCNRRIEPSKINRHDGGESQLHNKKLAEKYAKELRQIREERHKLSSSRKQAGKNSTAL